MTSRRTLSTLLLIALLVASTTYPVVSAREHKETESTDPTSPSEPTEPARGKGKGPPRNESQQPRSAGNIVQAGPSQYDGRYVDFSFDPSSCQITNYMVYDQTILASIQLPAPCEGKGKGGSGERGASSQFGGKDAYVRVHDAPNGLVQIAAGDNKSILLVPASGATLNETDHGSEFVLGNLTGLLRVDDDRSDAWNVTGKARFWVHPLAGGSPERVEIREAIKAKKVAAEVDVLFENGSVSNEIFTYEDVIMKASRSANGTFRFLVDANLTEGRTFVINVGPGLFKDGKVGLQYWDLDETNQEHEVAITLADDLADVLEITEGEGPEYWITDDAAGKHVLVAVPHFSAHVFEIASLPAEVVPIVIWGLIGGLAFVGLGATGMFRRRPI